MIIGPLIKRFLCAILGDSKAQYVMNEWLMFFWIANFIAVHIVFFLAPAVWSKVAILYLADISVYACIGQHYTGLAASLAGRKADEDRAPSEPEHLDVVVFGQDSFTVLHPLKERLGDLFACQIHTLCNQLPGPPEGKTGRYRAWVGDTGDLVLQPVTDTL